MKQKFLSRVKEDNFYSAWYALRDTLEGYYFNSNTNQWEWGYNADENAIREALEDFNDIVTQLLTSDGSIVKSLEKAANEAPATVIKAGKSLSNKNLNALKGIYDTFGSFLSEFETEGEPEGTTNNVQKEEIDMTKDEVQKLVGEEVAKAMEPITKQLEAIAKGEGDPAPAAEPAAEPDQTVTAEAVAKMVGDAVSQAMEPVTKALEPLLKSRALPGNLNDSTGTNVQKNNEEPHYMTGMF
jgi:hypothetical protein